MHPEKLPVKLGKQGLMLAVQKVSSCGHSVMAVWTRRNGLMGSWWCLCSQSAGEGAAMQTSGKWDSQQSLEVLEMHQGFYPWLIHQYFHTWLINNCPQNSGSTYVPLSFPPFGRATVLYVQFLILFPCSFNVFLVLRGWVGRVFLNPFCGTAVIVSQGCVRVGRDSEAWFLLYAERLSPSTWRRTWNVVKRYRVVSSKTKAFAQLGSNWTVSASSDELRQFHYPQLAINQRSAALK